MAEHRNLTGASLHEPKGVASANEGQVYTADGAGSGEWLTPVYMGWEDYEHAGGGQSLTEDAKVTLENDGAGSNTNTSFALPNTSGIWDPSTNRFDWNAGGCDVGDTVHLRFDLDVTVNTNNDLVALYLDMALGDPIEFELPVWETNVDQDGTTRFTPELVLYIGSNEVLNNPAQVSMFAASAGDTIQVNGWLAVVHKRIPVFV